MGVMCLGRYSKRHMWMHAPVLVSELVRRDYSHDLSCLRGHGRLMMTLQRLFSPENVRNRRHQSLTLGTRAATEFRFTVP